MKRFATIALLTAAGALPAMAAEEVMLDTQGQALFARLSEAIQTDNCDNIIAYGYEFKRGYQSYLDAHPKVSETTESNLSRCVNAMLMKSKPLEPENLGHGAVPAGAPE